MISPKRLSTEYKTGLHKEYMLSRDGLGGSTGKGKGSSRIKVMHILRELKEICGADIVLIKSGTRKLRREAESDEVYKQIIENNNE